MNTAQNRPSWLRPALLLLLLAAFALRLVNLNLQDIWWDEARNLDVALSPLAGIATAPALDIQPPLYYYLLHLWFRVAGIGMGDNPATLAWLARFVSLFFGVLLAPLVAALAKRLAGAPHGDFAQVAALAIGAFSPFWLAESQETRMYTLALALLTGAALALLEALSRREKRLATQPRADALATAARGRRGEIGHLAAFALCSAAAFLVHYNALFVLVAWYAWWLVSALAQRGGWTLRWSALQPLLLSGLATTLLVLPIAPVALRQIPDYGNPNLVVPAASDYLIQNLAGHLAGYTWETAALFGKANWWLWLSLALAACGLALLVMRRPRSTHLWRDLSFLLVWFAGGLLLYYVAVLDRGAFNIRYSAMVTPALVALIAAGMAGWHLRPRLPLGWLALLLLLAGMLPFVRSDLSDPRFFREDMQGVANWLRANTHAGDVIFVDQKYPFAFYYDNYEVSPDKTPSGVEAAPARYLFVDTNTLAGRLDDWAADAQRVFWVQWFESDTDPRHTVPFLLNQNGAHAGEQWFQGWSIDWWEMRPPNHFALGAAMSPLVLRFTNPDGSPAVQTVEASLPGATPGAGNGDTGNGDSGNGDSGNGNAAGVPVVIRWQRMRDSGAIRPLKARVALYDSDDNRLAQSDERLLSDRHVAPGEWDPAEAPLNVYLPAPETPLAPGRYALRLLVYDAETLEPLTLLDAAGNPAGIEADLGEIVIE